MTSWATNRIQQERQRLTKNTVKLSKLVESGKLSSSAAKTVFSEMYDAHRKNLFYITQIDELWG